MDFFLFVYYIFVIIWIKMPRINKDGYLERRLYIGKKDEWSDVWKVSKGTVPISGRLWGLSRELDGKEIRIKIKIEVV